MIVIINSRHRLTSYRIPQKPDREYSFRIASLTTTWGDGLNVKPDAITQTLSHDLLGGKV